MSDDTNDTNDTNDHKHNEMFDMMPLFKINKTYGSLSVCTFNAYLDQSIYKKEKIYTIIDLVENENIDVLCLQNITDIKTLKKLIKEILGLNMCKLFFYPHVYPLCKNHNGIESSYSSSTPESYDGIIPTFNEDNEEFSTEYNNFVISKYPIISAKLDVLCMFIGVTYYVSTININYNNNIVSIFNTTFQTDFSGISNKNVRKIQINQLKEIVKLNTVKITNEYSNKHKILGLNILCINLNVPEFKNGMINSEFINSLRTLKCLDIYKYTKMISKITRNTSVLRPTRKDFMFVLLDDINDEFANIDEYEEFVKVAGKYIYDKYSTSIISYQNIYGYEYFDNYPILCNFLILST
jgi:hypothetical protein